MDVGPALTAKVLKSNGWVVYVSTYRALTEDELANPSDKKERDLYDDLIRIKLGNPMTASDLEQYEAVTPEFALYDDDMHPSPTQIPDIDDVTPEEYNQYVGAVAKFPLRRQKGQVL